MEELVYEIVSLDPVLEGKVLAELLSIKHVLEERRLLGPLAPTALLILTLAIWKKAGVTKGQARGILEQWISALEEGN